MKLTQIINENEEPVKSTGEKIQNLNNRIKALKDKMAATKSSEYQFEANAVSGGKVHKFITGKNLTLTGKKYGDVHFELVSIDNKTQIVKLRVIGPKELFGQEISMDFRTLRRGPFLKTDTKVFEATFRPTSGTMSGGTYRLDGRKYKLNRDVKGVQIGDYTNVTLPKGTIIYNIPGGVFAHHDVLAAYQSRQTPYYNQSTFNGISIRREKNVILSIEKNSKLLESTITERQLKESVNEAKFKSPDYIISTTPASSLPQQRLGHADVMIGLKMAEKLKNYTLHVRHYKLVHVDGKVALKLTPEGKTAVRVRTEDDPKYLQLIQKTVNDVVADYVSKLKESVNEGAGTLTIEKRKDGKYYWQYKFKSGKTEDWPAGFNTKADAQKDFMYRSKYIKESVNEAELKLGVKYVNKNGKEGFIQTGGSKNSQDWFWFDGKVKHPYDKVKKELTPSKDQKKTGFSDYLKQGGRVWDNVNPTNSPSVNEETYKVAGRPVTLIKGKKSNGTDWKVKFQNGKETSLSDVIALIKPFPKDIKESVNELNLNESVFSAIDLIRQDAKDVRDFVKKVFSDRNFKDMKNDKDFIKYLKSIYEGVSVTEASGRVPQIFLKTGAVEKKIKELMADRKKAVVPYNTEKDPAKKESLKQMLIKLTKQIQGYEKNLVQLRDKEEEYIQQMNADAQLDVSATD